MADMKTDVAAGVAVAEPRGQDERPTDLPTCEAPCPDVQAFIRENDLEKWLDVTFQLIGRHFSTTHGVTVAKKQDPELSDEWVSVRVVAGGEADAILDAYDAFTLEMVSAIPAEAGRKIRLSLGMG